jgi:hypothetical protein
MTEKKPFPIRMLPQQYAELKEFARFFNRSQGDLLAGLLRFAKSPYLMKDPEFQRRFIAFRDQCVLNAGRVAYRAGEAQDQLPFVAEDFFAGLPPTDQDKEQSR